jgi:hypothetical protein
VQTPSNTIPAEARVSALIDQDNNAWNATTMKEFFWEEEANIILNIPLSQLKSRDRWIWRCTKNGDFSIRSVRVYVVVSY